MINLTCPKCSQAISVPDSYEGKRIKCKKCETIITVPSVTVAALLPDEEEQPTKQCQFCGETVLAVAKKCKHCGETLDNPVAPKKKSPSLGAKVKNLKGHILSDARRQALTKIMPLWVWLTLVGFLFVMVVGLGLYCGLRDTWERDHYAEIKALDEQASIAVNSGNPKEGLETYDRLFQLVGSRVLKGATKDILDSAKANYSVAQEKYEEQLLASLTPVAEDASTLYLRQEYSQALDKYTLVCSTLTARPLQGDRIKQFVQAVENGKQMAQSEVQKRQEQQRQEEAKRQAELAKAEAERQALENQRKERLDTIRTNPSQAFQLYCKDFMSHLSTILGGKVDSTYEISLERTTNELVPYLGILVCNKTVRVTDTSTTYQTQDRITFALQDNRWDLRATEHRVWTVTGWSSWREVIEEENIQKAYEETPNP